MKKDSYIVKIRFESDASGKDEETYNVRLAGVHHEEYDEPALGGGRNFGVMSTYTYEVINTKTNTKEWEEYYGNRIDTNGVINLVNAAFRNQFPVLARNVWNKELVLVDDDELVQEKENDREL